MGDRYRYDFHLCRAVDGWAQLDTRQDASYHGIWINPVSLKLFSYVEGDTTLTECESEAEFITAARICFEWHKEHGYFIGVDAMEAGGAKQAFVRMGLGEYLHEEIKP
jgi:peptidoglycan/xylan/chitin deacetylase (PgdA/CDA1 family)